MILRLILENFSLILLLMTIITGTVWLIERFYLRTRRHSRADIALGGFDACSNRLSLDIAKLQRSKLKEELLRQPIFIEYSNSFFPVIAMVFLLRSFLY